MSDLEVSLLGFGTVGQALARRLAADPSGIRIVSVTDSHGYVEDAGGLDPAELLREKRERGTIAKQKGALAFLGATDAVVDLLPTDLRTGGLSVHTTEEALWKAKAVVTASKGALAVKGPLLREVARQAGSTLLASATVCAGTPVLELLRHAFRGDRLERFDAVLNGSTNVVLSLLEDGVAWETALADARAQGILEADPSLDLLGLDAAAKAVILANEAWGARWTLADADVRGIAGITAREASEAKANGLALRLVARGSPERGIHVAPVALARDHPLVTEGTENAVRLKLRDAGTITLRGPGAGGAQTAAAVLSDLLAVQRERSAGHARRVAEPVVAPVVAPLRG